ncbi:2-keto-4-pentenoate hydratase [Actinomycetospora corticicola]|uniref:2-oxo-3-hexenedioate decarboxylase n=1 Tax=Actinomycetospora corticicola TaxID=663602 RepID=A0A7Y9E1J7_9PSEU|nr:hydratase [Actinomycetospora corticicola]NYD39446.1 2-oxo-3-hexenedioate decarboxylase [Actinomycetospora corticicola]
MTAMEDRRVDRLLGARDTGARLPRDPDLDLDAAYLLAAEVEQRLGERGNRRVGRKIGFTNRGAWDAHGLDRPIWAPVYDTTLTRCRSLSLGALPEPRLEPEIVLGVSRYPEIAWAALGVEIVASHHPGWRFSPAEAVADFGLHAMLVLGPQLPVDGLADVEVALSGPGFSTTGRGANALGGPRHALAALADLPGATPVADGEIVTTGTLVDPPWIEPGQRWTLQVAGGPELTVTTRP